MLAALARQTRRAASACLMAPLRGRLPIPTVAVDAACGCVQRRDLATKGALRWRPGDDEPLRLNNLAPAIGARTQRRRVGRGIGSGRGKTCKKGHKGQRARSGGSVRLGFEGGQTPLHIRVPKRGFRNGAAEDLDTVTVDRVRMALATGRLRPRPGDFITMKDLQDAGVVNRIRQGLKLLGDDTTDAAVPGSATPLHLEVSAASAAAIAAIEAKGGTVTCAHFNRLSLRALLKPHKFALLPRRAAPPPKDMPSFLDFERRGYLSPEVQARNLKLFGRVTSEVHQPHHDLH